MGRVWVRCAVIGVMIAGAALSWLVEPRALVSGMEVGADAGAGANFDYYVLSLSWSPSYCEAEARGRARDAAQCGPGAHWGFILHGLWPQRERGWPSACAATTRGPTEREVSAMLDISPAPGLARHQWRKHGTCSGLTPHAYFAAARRAFGAIAQPEIFKRLRRSRSLAPRVVEAAFIDANPGLTGDGVTIVCRGGLLREVRICLDKDLALRRCGPDAIRDCAARSLRMPPVR